MLGVSVRGFWSSEEEEESVRRGKCGGGKNDFRT